MREPSLAVSVMAWRYKKPGTIPSPELEDIAHESLENLSRPGHSFRFSPKSLVTRSRYQTLQPQKTTVSIITIQLSAAMKFLSILATLALASTAVALPKLGANWRDWHGADPKCPESNCLTQIDADAIVSKFISILDHRDVATANATAQGLIADGFFEESDSINMLAGHPVCTKTLRPPLGNAELIFPGRRRHFP